jgi:hypothetical protein
MTTQGIPGADLQFFTELRSILVDHDQPIGNRLQMVDARIAMLSGAPQISKVKHDHRPLSERVEKRQPMTLVADEVTRLTELATAMGLVFTVERRPLTPLAMGHAAYAVTVWEARRPS